MQFEVTDKKETREGLLIKKPVYLAHVAIRLNDEEFEALSSMAKSKEWKMYPLGEIALGDKHRRNVSMEMFFSWAKKSHAFEIGVRTPLPEDREMQISDLKEVASNLKQVLEARLTALNASDEDETIEI